MPNAFIVIYTIHSSIYFSGNHLKSIRFRIFRNRFVSSYLGVVRLLSMFTIRIQWKETFIRIFFQHISSVVSIVKARHTYKLSLHAPPITPPLALPCLLFPLVFALEFADSIEFPYERWLTTVRTSFTIFKRIIFNTHKSQHKLLRVRENLLGNHLSWLCMCGRIQWLLSP